MKLFFAFTGILLASIFCLAQVPAVPVPTQDFLAQVLDAVHKFGGLSTMLKISSVILLIVTSMKVSFLNDLVWSKMGAAQAWMGPLLGLIGGVLSLGVGDVKVSAASIFAYVSAGAGAILLHELLDTVKALPFLGPVYVTVINMVEGFLGGPAPVPVVSPPK